MFHENSPGCTGGPAEYSTGGPAGRVDPPRTCRHAAFPGRIPPRRRRGLNGRGIEGGLGGAISSAEATEVPREALGSRRWRTGTARTRGGPERPSPRSMGLSKACWAEGRDLGGSQRYIEGERRDWGRVGSPSPAEHRIRLSSTSTGRNAKAYLGCLLLRRPWKHLPRPPRLPSPPGDGKEEKGEEGEGEVGGEGQRRGGL